LKKIEIPEVKVKTFDEFEGATGIFSRNYFEGRFLATEKGIDGDDDVMVIDPLFDNPMQITPDLKRNAGVKYMDQGLATETKRSSSPRPQSHDPALAEAQVMGAVFGSMMGMPPVPLLVEGIKTLVEEVEEVIELNESDLIFEPAPVFSSSVSGPRDLTHFFDLSDVEPFNGRAFESVPAFSEAPLSPFHPEEEAWFIDPDSWISDHAPSVSEGFEVIPPARTVAPLPKNWTSTVGDLFRGIWNAWKSETGRYPFLFMGFQYLLGGGDLITVALPPKAHSRLFFTNENILSDDFQKIIQDPRLKNASVIVHRLSSSIKVLNYGGEVTLRRKISEEKTEEIRVPVLDGSGDSIAAVPNLNPATDTLVINGLEIRFPEGK